MKVYAGWVVEIAEKGQFLVTGSLNIRGVQSYTIKKMDETKQKMSIKRDDFLSGFNGGTIKYIKSVAV